MKVCIVTNLNGIGLQRDFEIVSDILTGLGHEVTGIQFDAPREDPAFIELMQGDYQLSIFLEVLPVDLVRLSPVNWIFANAEWVRPEMVKLIERHCDKIFAKTHEAQRIFEPLWPGKVFYVGFTCRDQYLPEIERRPWFLHIGGNSSLRGTQAVLDAWKWQKNGKGLGRHLIVVSRALKERPEIPMVTYHDDMDEERLRVLQNQCLFHIHPSATEGFGHALRESQTVGAVIFTTDAPPMNEMDNVELLPSRQYGKFHLADLYEVSAIDIHETARRWLEKPQIKNLNPDGVIRGDNALGRGYFHDADVRFREAFAAHLQDIGPKRTPRKKSRDVLDIAFIGNFKAEHSTENQIKWALEEGLGHNVEMLQENEVRFSEICAAAQFSDLLFWVRTPGWLNVPDREMFEFLEKTEVPTVSIHLDKFFSIPEREALIGKIPFWKCKWVFTADGSRQDDFKARGVNHFWMRPAVSEVFCHPGIPREEFLCDVGFVGSRAYHDKEYPFRGQLIAFLEVTYGDRFKLIDGGVRGHLLNDAYASMQVIVGDCIFSGTPRYWSDRVPETMGRYGFLVHPLVEELPPVADVYKPQNLGSLRDCIERSLKWSSRQRKNIVEHCAAHVRTHDTWTLRLAEILNTVLK
jgi:hypothetical protein